MSKKSKSREPRVLILDIETAPIIGYVWSIWQQNVGLNQIVSDWHLLSWAAKWLDKPEVMYMDQRNAADIEDDTRILKGVWRLLNAADVVITQNGIAFDTKKLNARFIEKGFLPPSPYRQLDTKVIAKKHFGFTSNKLEYMTDKLNVKYKKLKHKKFEGFELWKECLAGNLEAWKEMETYNKHDVLALEELYNKLAPWGTGINFNQYRGTDKDCECDAPHVIRYGHFFTAGGKYQRYRCQNCGTVTRDTKNLQEKGSKKRRVTS